MFSDVFLVLDSHQPDHPAPWEADSWNQPEPAHNGEASRTILVVDDDATVRLLLQRLLTEAGYEVTSATSGLEALQAALEAQPPVDLAITDIRMPHMDGWELARRLGERWPGLPILYLSGYTSELSRLPQSEKTAAAFLRKPFDPDELLRRVALLLE
jgi:CheY-like chemotaxis protein